MKSRPILFSAPMVRAILAGAKTQTRRVGKGFMAATFPDTGEQWYRSPSPYGEPGDRLWVRETFASFRDARSTKPTEAEYVVFADGVTMLREGRSIRAPDAFDPSRLKWRPSIHMPRWASRILLDVTDVRVERLQDISEDDARAEGVRLGAAHSFRESYEWLWDEINGRRAPWSSNPWCWCITFRRVT
jgi:hypothetical protein